MQYNWNVQWLHENTLTPNCYCSCVPQLAQSSRPSRRSQKGWKFPGLQAAAFFSSSGKLYKWQLGPDPASPLGNCSLFCWGGGGNRRWHRLQQNEQRGWLLILPVCQAGSSWGFSYSVKWSHSPNSPCLCGLLQSAGTDNFPPVSPPLLLQQLQTCLAVTLTESSWHVPRDQSGQRSCYSLAQLWKWSSKTRGFTPSTSELTSICGSWFQPNAGL